MASLTEPAGPSVEEAESLSAAEAPSMATGPDCSSIALSTALVSPTEKEFELIEERINGLMDEGRGECIFDLGVALVDAGAETEQGDTPSSGLREAEFAASLATLESVATSVNAECVFLR